jgi:RHS repeat-associated protein
MDREGVVQWLVGDHLGSTSLVMDHQGSKVAESRHYPYGEERWRWPQEGTFPTEYRFTGQKLVDSAGGIYHMGARFYDPALGRWLSADTIVPGTAAGRDNGVTEVGYDDQVRLTPLTVGFHATQLLPVISEENREILVQGKSGSKYAWGPQNPQALNRFAYCTSNPLGYVDPSGYYLVDLIDVQLTAEEAEDLLTELTWWLSAASGADTLVDIIDMTSVALEAAAAVMAGSVVGSPAAPGLAAAGVLVFAGDQTLEWTIDDLQELRYTLAMESEGSTQGVHLTFGTDIMTWGVEVNGKEAIGHLGFSGSGSCNATPQFLLAWWLFDCGY